MLFGEVFFSFEAFQGNYQDLWSFVDLHLLLCQHEFLAFWAIPSVVFTEDLGLLEKVEAISYLDT